MYNIAPLTDIKLIIHTSLLWNE